MRLTPGCRVGSYEIITLIGAGGMGEVYRARDGRLGRDVAIKVLSATFAADPERLHRFEAEARAAAALNHPNILALYDIGSVEGTPYLVCELLEGDTLRAQLGQGLPVRKAIDYATQIARGLAAAHDRGIVHRDLKPENIFITIDGRAKILDFGLAKLTERDAAIARDSLLPTAVPDTAPGIVLGTVGYMAPEQVRGTTAYHRADIFAFGAVLYEMLSGVRAFRGDTTADTMTAILKEDPPDLPAAGRGIPPGLARIVNRCLEKSPTARFQSAHDLAFALEALSSNSDSAQVVAAASFKSTSRNRFAWTVAAAFALLFVAAFGAAAYLFESRQPLDVRTTRFSFAPPEGWSLALETLSGGPVPNPIAVSPDGRKLVFVARMADRDTQLWIRSFDALDAVPLHGTDGAGAPFWSPDSQSVAFFANGKLKKIEMAGGPVLTLCDAGLDANGSWSGDVILFASIRAPIRRVPASGGTPVDATVLGANEVGHTRPVFLPDGRHFLYHVLDPRSSTTEMLASLDSRSATKLLETGSTNVAYSRGYLLFLRDTALVAQPFDVRKLALVGNAFPISDQIQMQTIGAVSSGIFSASQNGVLAYQLGSSTNGGGQLVWVNRSGKPIAAASDRALYGDVELSPDGKRVSVSVMDPIRRLRDQWLVDVSTSLRTRFTFERGNAFGGIWSPTGDRIVFASNDPSGPYNLFAKPASGTGTLELLLTSPSSTGIWPLSWSRDGRFLLYAVSDPKTLGDVWVLPMGSVTGKPFPLLHTAFNESSAFVSPDGRWVAYVSDESGNPQVYVTSFPDAAGKWQISRNGADSPRWSHDGHELYYVSDDGKLNAVGVHGSDTAFDVGSSKPLFAIKITGPRTFYDISPDDQRFLVLGGAAPEAVQAPITIVMNWPEELNQRASTH